MGSSQPPDFHRQALLQELKAEFDERVAAEAAAKAEAEAAAKAESGEAPSALFLGLKMVGFWGSNPLEYV